MSSMTPGRNLKDNEVLTRFQMLDLDKTFTEASEGWSLSSDTTSRFIRNLHVLHDSRKRLEGQVETWQGIWCWILDETFTEASEGWFLSSDTTSRLMSSMTPGRDLEERWNLDIVPDVRSWWNYQRHFWWMLPPIWHHLQVHQECPCSPRIQEETWM